VSGGGSDPDFKKLEATGSQSTWLYLVDYRNGKIVNSWTNNLFLNHQAAVFAAKTLLFMIGGQNQHGEWMTNCFCIDMFSNRIDNMPPLPEKLFGPTACEIPPKDPYGSIFDKVGKIDDESRGAIMHEAS